MGKVEYISKVKPLTGEFFSGDIAWSKQFNECLLLCLIDVAGHGKLAHDIADACITILETNYQKNLIDIILAIEIFLKDKARGLVIGLALVELSTGSINYMGVGNIKTRIIGQQSYRFVSRPGVLGFTKLHPILEKYLLNDNDILLMYSDGISDRFEKDKLPNFKTMSVEQLSQEIITNFSKKTDDCSCIVMRYLYD